MLKWYDDDDDEDVKEKINNMFMLSSSSNFNKNIYINREREIHTWSGKERGREKDRGTCNKSSKSTKMLE